MIMYCRNVIVLLACWSLSMAVGGAAPSPQPAPPEAFKIGALLDFTGALGEFGPSAENGVRLAIQQVNAAGGVLGRPVEVVLADAATSPETTLKALDRLLDEGVHAIVGPMGSAATLAVADAVVAARVPLVSPAATAPQITDLDDDGFIFRATASDAAQGPALAELARTEGIERIAILYLDDPYGRGLAASFAAAFDGEVTARVAIEPEKPSYLDELRRAAAGSPQALLAVTFPFETVVFLREAMEGRLFDRFLFADALGSPDLVRDLGAEALEGIKGTAPMRITDPAALAAFNEAHQAAFGQPSGPGPVAASFDSVVCLCLAVEQARSTDGPAIRDALRQVCGGGGERVSSVAAALEAVRAGRDVDYDGFSSSMDWNAAGDITSGIISVWQFQNGVPTPIDMLPYHLD